MIRLEIFIHGLATTPILIEAGPTSCLWLVSSRPSVVTHELSILASTTEGRWTFKGVQKLGRERGRLELSRCKGSVASWTAECRGKLDLPCLNVASNALMFKLWKHGFKPGSCMCFDSCCLAHFFFIRRVHHCCKIIMAMKLWSAWNTAAHHRLLRR
jgi:hypothetical protein